MKNSALNRPMYRLYLLIALLLLCLSLAAPMVLPSNLSIWVVPVGLWLATFPALLAVVAREDRER